MTPALGAPTIRCMASPSAPKPGPDPAPRKPRAAKAGAGPQAAPSHVGADDYLALRTLRRYTEGVLAFDDRRANVRFVIDRATGRLVMPVERAAISASQHVLFVPAESRSVMQLLLVMDTLPRPEAHEAPDRWVAYHAAFSPPRPDPSGAPMALVGPGGGTAAAPPASAGPGNSAGAQGGGVWAVATIEAAKTETLVFSPEELGAANALRADEPRLIRELNKDKAALARACRRHCGVDVADPVAVGLDPLGIDVRARFGILRLEFSRHANSADEALSAANALMVDR